MDTSVLKQSTLEGGSGMKGFVIHPGGRPRIVILSTTVALLGYITIAVPLIIGFELEPDGLWLAFEYLADFFFLFDVFANFFTGVVLPDSSLLMDQKKIAWRYARSIDCPIDLAVAVPYDLLFRLAMPDARPGGDEIYLIRVGRALKVVKVKATR
jgi:hypothetical protein